MLFYPTLVALMLAAPPAPAGPGETIADAPVIHAPGPYASDGRVVRAGTTVEIGVCFFEGAYCYIEAGDLAGYVEGRLLAVSGGRMDELEAKRWARLRLQASLPREALMIATWGDSLTAGAGLPVVETYPAQAEALFGYTRDIANGGIGGQNSTAIAARMNAVPTLLTFAGETIGAGGSTAIVERSTTPLTSQGPRAMAGTVCGIDGMLAAETADGGKTYAYSFSRSRPGEEVPCPAGSLFRFTAADVMGSRVQWIWAGTNGADSGRKVVDDIAAMVASLTHDRFLVGALPSGAEHSEARIAAAKSINAALAKAHGERFVDLVAALADGGDGSAGDAADVAAGIIPRSLRVDALHLNARGNAIVAKAFHDATLKLGF
jgi:lysophospholipase L1-like esterase